MNERVTKEKLIARWTMHIKSITSCGDPSVFQDLAMFSLILSKVIVLNTAHL